MTSRLLSRRQFVRLFLFRRLVSLSFGFFFLLASVRRINLVAKKYEPKYRLIRNGLDTKVEKLKKQLKERKNRAKKIRGVKKTKASDAAKAGKKK